MNDAEEILKVDVTGRVWTSRQRREALLDEFAEGGGVSPCICAKGRLSVRCVWSVFF